MKNFIVKKIMFLCFIVNNVQPINFKTIAKTFGVISTGCVGVDFFRSDNWKRDSLYLLAGEKTNNINNIIRKNNSKEPLSSCFQKNDLDSNIIN